MVEDKAGRDFGVEAHNRMPRGGGRPKGQRSRGGGPKEGISGWRLTRRPRGNWKPKAGEVSAWRIEIETRFTSKAP